MKAIVKQNFSTNRDHKVGDVLELDEGTFERFAAHGYVGLPEEMLENETGGAANEGGPKSDEASQSGGAPESSESSTEAAPEAGSGGQVTEGGGAPGSEGNPPAAPAPDNTAPPKTEG